MNDMNSIFFADHADRVIDFASCKNSRKQKQCECCTSAELEALITDIRLFMQHARTDGDVFEYYRLSEELVLAEAARSEGPQLSLI